MRQFILQPVFGLLIRKIPKMIIKRKLIHIHHQAQIRSAPTHSEDSGLPLGTFIPQNNHGRRTKYIQIIITVTAAKPHHGIFDPAGFRPAFQQDFPHVHGQVHHLIFSQSGPIRCYKFRFQQIFCCSHRFCFFHFSYRFDPRESLL